MTDNADTTATGRPYWQTPDGKHLAACEERASRERFFPPIPQGSPLHARYESITLGDEARIYSFTVIHPHPKSGKAPFALVKRTVEAISHDRILGVVMNAVDYAHDRNAGGYYEYYGYGYYGGTPGQK